MRGVNKNWKVLHAFRTDTAWCAQTSFWVSCTVSIAGFVLQAAQARAMLSSWNMFNDLLYLTTVAYALLGSKRIINGK